MTELILFAASMTAAAYFDFRKMKREGLRRELIVCALMCLAELAAAAWFFTSAHRLSVISLLLGLFGIAW
jgi:hypothetical protein